ncbi:MAG: hypothetical protein ACRDTM_00540 [Micromonosporaceae bacterium]
MAEIYCGQSDPDAQFELGLELMLRGFDNPADTSPAETRSAL